MKSITASELKYRYENNMENPGRHFFTRKTMNFFGDTMANFGVYQELDEKVNGESVPLYCLYRKSPAKCGIGEPHYFTEAGKAVYIDKEEVKATA